MCPLRYVLVLLSVLVALLLLWWPTPDVLLDVEGEGKTADEGAAETAEGEEAKRGSEGRAGAVNQGRKGGVLETLWEWSTGRYLYRVYRSSVKRQEELALANAGGEEDGS